MSAPVFRKKRKLLITCGAILLVLALLIGACGIYVGSYYHADGAAVSAFASEHAVSVQSLENGVAFVPENPTTGVIFYPGGKVEHTAYEPLMRALAMGGILCVLVEMPFRLAVLDVNAAEGILQQFPGVTDWYMAGHSLGGSMAAAYLEKHTDAFTGLILLGAYSTADLSQTTLRALSVYGSEDGVMNREKYEENKKNLPAAYSQYVIEGGNHANFGMYGEQKGDGKAALSPAQQIELTAHAILAFAHA